ncbi:MAG: hypothetical protein Q4D91_08030 [Lautropia sp.]|nr:hypothetical protein [Lautropia sp.]
MPVAQLVLSAFNHITRQQPHLRESLLAHQGRVLRIHVLSPAEGHQRHQGQTDSPAHAANTPKAGGRVPRAADTATVGAGAGSSSGFPADWAARLLPAWQSDARIGADGTLSAVSGESPAATLTVRPSADALFAALKEGPQALGASLRIEGDVMLASALGQLARSLHWDVEEDLSRVVGDVAAHRAGMGWRAAREQASVVRERARDALVQHLSHDEGVLVSRAAFDAFTHDLRRLDQQLAQLEARVVG